ncbi:MAG: autotransporter-associated beta strand repeat-containing protein [Thermoguttaceae bacterium]|nr:autotransporter-associated beta strand repeat-containing protein [Thermoguttaceae bacterium]
MSNSQTGSFTRGLGVIIAFLAVLLSCSYSSADVVYSDTDPDNPIPTENVTTGSGGVGNVTFNISEAGAYDYIMSGNGTVTKTGDGALTLSKRNTYSGGTFINTGKVIATAENASASTFGTGAIEIASGATLEFQVSNQLGYGTNAPNDITVKGTFIPSNFTHAKNFTLQNGVIEREYGFTDAGTGLDFEKRTATITSTGNSFIKSRLRIRNTSNVTIKVDSDTLTIDGVIHDAGGFTKTGAGTLKLTAANTFTGGITVNAGKLLVTDSSVGTGKTTNNGAIVEFNADSGKTITITNQVGNYTSGGVQGKTIKTGAGTLSTNTWISGLVEVQQGTLKLTDSFGSNSKRFNGTITILNGATLDCTVHDSLGYGEANTIMNIYGTVSLTATNSNETLKYTTLHLYGGTVKSTNGTTLDVCHNNVSFYSYALDGASETSPTVSTISSNIRIRSGGASDTLDITTTANSQLKLTGTIKNNENEGKNCKIVKLGDGTLVLSARNEYKGGTTISEGRVIANAAQSGGISTFGTGAVMVASGATLEFQVSNQLGTGNSPNDITIKGTLIPSNYTHVKNITLENGVIESEYGYNNSGSGLDYSTRTATLSSSGTSKIKSRINIDNTAKITVDVASDSTLSIEGVIKGAGGYTKSGDGTLELTADNTYTGTTTISAGTIKLTGNGDLGDGSVVNNGNLEFAYTTEKSFSNVISGTGTVTKSGDETLTLSGANTYSGTTTVSAGVLELTDAAVVANGPTTVAQNATLEYNVASGSKLLEVDNSSKISGAGNVVKTGDGILQIKAAEGAVDVHSLVISSGRLDMKSYFKGALEIGEELDEGYTTATFSPGNSIGPLTVEGDFTLNPGSTLLLEFNSTGADSLEVTGTTTFAEGSIISLQLEEGASPAPNQQVTFQIPSGIDTYNNATLVYPSYLVGMDYDRETGIISAMVDANAIPEPSTWALLALGIVVLFLRKRS